MDTRQALLVDAFAAEPTTGTPTGVVPEADGLTDDQMQAVASELGATETAFVLPAEDADRRLRCFSPTKELAQAETAAVAAHAALYERGEIDDSEWTVATARGDVAVETKQNGMVWVEQGRADITEVDIPYSDVADALGLNAATLKDVGADLPLVTAGVGESWLMVPVNYFEHLSGLTMDVAAVDSLCDRVDAAGVYPFTFDTVGADATRRSTFHGRAFRVGRRRGPARRSFVATGRSMTLSNRSSPRVGTSATGPGRCQLIPTGPRCGSAGAPSLHWTVQ